MFKQVIKQLLPPVIKKLDTGQEEQKQPVSVDLKEVIQLLEQYFGDSSDLILRKLLIGNGTLPALIVYLENTVDKKIVNKAIEKLQEAPTELLENVKVMAYSVLPVSNVTIVSDMKKITDGLLIGHTAIFISGSTRAVLAATTGWEKRGIETSQREINVEGPLDAFVESKAVNLTLIRRRIRDSRLRFEDLVIGTRTQDSVAVIHLEGITDPGLVAEVKSRLQRIHIDGLLSVQTVNEFLKDQPLTPFPTLLKTELPNKVVSFLLEGKVIILVDGYPQALVGPITFVNFLQSGDDYYSNFYYGTFLRWIRMFAFLVTLVLPSLWIALTTHHWEMMPTALALSIAGGREGVPFPAFMEVVAMEFTFEVLREAGIRLPRAVGQAVSIVGALVIGQSAVQAGLVSPAIVIVVAFTGITSFAIPIYSASIPFRLLRFPLMLISAQLGLPGLVAGVLMIWGHMISLTSLGIPYMAPFTPLQAKDIKDTLVRVPRWAMATRPQSVPSMDTKRINVDDVPPREGT